MECILAHYGCTKTFAHRVICVSRLLNEQSVCLLFKRLSRGYVSLSESAQENQVLDKTRHFECNTESIDQLKSLDLALSECVQEHTSKQATNCKSVSEEGFQDGNSTVNYESDKLKVNKKPKSTIKLRKSNRTKFLNPEVQDYKPSTSANVHFLDLADEKINCKHRLSSSNHSSVHRRFSSWDDNKSVRNDGENSKQFSGKLQPVTSKPNCTCPKVREVENEEYYLTSNRHSDSQRTNGKSSKIKGRGKIELKQIQNVMKSNKRLSSTLISKSIKTSHQKPKIEPSQKSIVDHRRFNEVDIEMLPRSLYEQVFGTIDGCTVPTAEQVEYCRSELIKQNLLKPPSFSTKSAENKSQYDLSHAENEQLSVKDIHQWSPPVAKDIESNVKTEREKVQDATLSAIQSLHLPTLLGGNIEKHFEILGEAQAAPYRTLLTQMVEAAKSYPRRPERARWEMWPGWTRYDVDGGATRVECPPDDALVFDVEVCCQEGALPTLAVAAAPKSQSWYGWVSKSLAEGSGGVKGAGVRISPEDMIPLEPAIAKLRNSRSKWRPRVIVAHHAAYDRSRVREQYWMHDTGTRFVDTMSLHVCVSGVTDEQRVQLRSGSAEHEPWHSVGALNALPDLARLYCPDLPSHSKELRDVFVSGSLTDVRNQFAELMDYCASDVFVTLTVLNHLLPLFLKRFPHPVTLAGMLELGTAFLPVDGSWERYLAEADATYEEIDAEVHYLLSERADGACHLAHSDAYRQDKWMWDQDWSTQELKLKKPLISKKGVLKKNEAVKMENDTNDQVEEPEDLYARFEKLACETGARLPARAPHMPGYPSWYRKLCGRKPSASDWLPGPSLLTTGMQVAPKLLRLTWEGHPLHYLRGYGWGFLLPSPSESGDLSYVFQSDVDLGENTNCSDLKSSPPDWYKGTGVWTGIEVEGHWFLKLPHKDGENERVGSPLARDFVGKWAQNVLGGDCEGAKRVLEAGRALSYWRNNRERVHGQLVAWSGPDRGVILPQVVVSGTVTRRAVEPTWMTASNARSDRVGSELRAMVRAPPGYCLVGADVDSQELWIASLLGDAASAGMHGGTPLGWMTLAGRKKDGTDMHSVTARAAGISRDQAKVLNYARIYGAGPAFAERLLRQFNPGISDHEARSAARRMFALTKGRRLFRPRPSVHDVLGENPVTQAEALRCARRMGKPLGELFEPPRWMGGTESAMFSRLEEVACGAQPRTPFLGGQLTRALEGGDDRSLPTRVNWVVQSGAVDFLHLLLVALRWLLPENARFCLSFHDEVRYLVPQRDKYCAAVALHVSNLLARAFCSSRVGLRDLPLSVAFFSSVEVDQALRKEATDDCITPSNPHGLSHGYGVPTGESLDLATSLQLCNGKPWLGVRHSRKRKKTDQLS